MADTTVTVVGNITGDPELRFTQNGVPVANVSVAVTPRIKDGDGWRDGDTSFYRVNVWREMAENVADTLQKGDRVVVVGRLQQRSWEDDEGNKRTVVEVVADEVSPSLRWATADVHKNNKKADKSEKSERRPTSRARSSRQSNTRESRPTRGGSFDEEMPA